MSNRQNKRKRKEFEKIQELERLKLENPEMCFCDNPTHNDDTDFLRHVSIPHYNPCYGEYFLAPVYRCQNCGKEITCIPAYA